jgi:hypothetical protein
LSERERPKAASAKVRARAAGASEGRVHAKLVPLRPVRDRDRMACETPPIEGCEAADTLATYCRECQGVRQMGYTGELRCTPEKRDTYWARCFSELEKD